MHSLSAPAKPQGRRVHQMEVTPQPPLRAGLCDYCGQSVSSGLFGRQLKYCDTACRIAFWRLARQRSAQVYIMLMRWRMHRGRKGTPGQGALTEVAEKVDAWLAEDRQARKEMEGAKCRS